MLCISSLVLYFPYFALCDGCVLLLLDDLFCFIFLYGMNTFLSQNKDFLTCLKHTLHNMLSMLDARSEHKIRVFFKTRH